jgi:hypothetical protein
MKSRYMRWAGHVACLEEMRNAYILAGKTEGKTKHEDILQLILGKWGGKLWIGFIWLRIEDSGWLL